MTLNPDIAGFLNRFFDKVFVVTLERAKDRQENIKKTFSPLAYEFFMGVDKKHLNLQLLLDQGIYSDSRAKSLNRHGKGMILGEIACSLSHRALYQHIISKKYQRVLVFEDDVVPLPENLLSLPETISELPADWELVYLGYTKYEEVTPALKRKHAFYKVISSLGLMKWNRTMVDNLLPVMYSNHLRVAGYHDCTHAYAVSASAARKFIDIQTPVAFNSDNLLSYTVLNGHLKAFITEPKFFDQEHFVNPMARSFIHH